MFIEKMSEEIMEMDGNKTNYIRSLIDKEMEKYIEKYDSIRQM